MKKIFALALAAVMTAGMTTVAFAEVNNNQLALTTQNSDATTVYFDEDGKDGVRSNEAFVSNAGKSIAGGKTLYIPIMDGTGYTWDSVVTSSKDVEDWKVSAKWDEGKPASKPEITTVKIDGTRFYAIAVEIPESENKAQLLNGTIKLYTTRSGNAEDRENGKITEEWRTVDLIVEYGFKEEDFDAVGDFADAQIVDFDDIDDVEMMDFGEYFSFEVNLDGQKKLNLKNNTEYQPEVADLDESANMDFINFVKSPSFNKIGTAYIYAADDTFLYEVVDGKLEALDADYNEDYEAWEFKTRTLGNYVISDKEIDTTTVTEDKTDDSSKTDSDVKENPDTGR